MARRKSRSPSTNRPSRTSITSSASGLFPNRSDAIETPPVGQALLPVLGRGTGKSACPTGKRAYANAVKERPERSRLAREAAKLDAAEEQALAEESYAGDVEWPEY